MARRKSTNALQITTNLAQIQPPAGDRFFIVLYVESARERVPFAPLDDPLLDRSHGPTIVKSAGESSAARDINPTHIVNCSIASRDDWLG
jgi:hypothetical protein